MLVKAVDFFALRKDAWLEGNNFFSYPVGEKSISVRKMPFSPLVSVLLPVNWVIQGGTRRLLFCNHDLYNSQGESCRMFSLT